MEIIVFGLTADPFTKAHGCIVETVAAKHPDAKILIVPSVVSWHRKDKPALFSESEREDIIKWWLNEKMPRELIGRVWLDAHEYSLPGFLRQGRGFIDYLRFLFEKQSEESTNNVFRFIIGEDEWAIFDKWKNHEEILRLAKPIVVRRGKPKEKNAPVGVQSDVETIELPAWCAEVSASAIREQFVGYFATARAYCATPEFWEIPREELLLHTPIFDVKKVDSDIPDFHPIRVESRDWVCVIVRKGGKYIGVGQTRWGTGKKYDEFVTGVVDPGEDALDAARRELREELGYSLECIGYLHYLGNAPTNPGFMTNAMHYYYVNFDDLEEGLGYEVVPPTPDEHERLERVEIDLENCFKGDTPALMLAGIALLYRYLQSKIS